MSTFLALVLAVSALRSAPLREAQAAPSGRLSAPARLEAEITRLASDSGGRVGVAALHLESGGQASLNGDEAFPMASTYKVPLAVQVLSRVDRGEVRLDQLVELREGDLHPGSGLLSELFQVPGVSLSVRNLLELTLRESDNSATDKLFELAGGGPAVTARLRTLGVTGIDVSRPTVDLIADWAGVRERPRTPAEWDAIFEAMPNEQSRAAAALFERDARDTATPRGMLALLERIYRKSALSAESSELLLDIMRRCRTGENRLKGLLPPATKVAHKTGTIGRASNDVGIIALPDGGGHVAVAVFVKESEKEIPARERVIAQIARALYDFYSFVPAASPKQ